MQTNHNPPSAIILAAGTSSRMGNGHHKLLLPLGEQSVLAHTIAATVASQARPIIVVLGHQAALVRSAIAPFINSNEIITIENPHFLHGMSTSIHAGIHALQSREPSPPGALIILGDQPLLSPHILDTLISAKNATSKPIVVPLYGGKRGNPVLFDRSLFPELLQVSGDEGGRSVIARHQQDVIGVELGSAVATYDVDTWEAYQEVVTAWQRKQKRSNE
jgi:molybdenum cofactor cytidylyltransferase